MPPGGKEGPSPSRGASSSPPSFSKPREKLHGRTGVSGQDAVGAVSSNSGRDPGQRAGVVCVCVYVRARARARAELH